jgi:hypothetical protein
MKTTIDIPDTLMLRCKQTAHEQHLTFRSLVEEGLHYVLDQREQRKKFKLREVPFQGGGFQTGFDESDWERIRSAAYEGHGE